MIFLEQYKFDDFTGGEPAFPLKNGGKIYSPGWEIPITWLLDSSGKVWIDGTFGNLPSHLSQKKNYFRKKKTLPKEKHCVYAWA